MRNLRKINCQERKIFVVELVERGDEQGRIQNRVQNLMVKIQNGVLMICLSTTINLSFV